MDGEQGEPKKKIMLYSMYTSKCRSIVPRTFESHGTIYILVNK